MVGESTKRENTVAVGKETNILLSASSETGGLKAAPVCKRQRSHPRLK